MDLLIDRDAAVGRTALDETAWVDVSTRFVPCAADRFNALHDTVPWMQNEVLRYDRYVPEQRLGAGLRGDSDPMLRQIGMHLQSRYGVPFTGVGALLYRDGDDFQGLHSDREMRWLDDTLIAIVVLGAHRPFVLRPRGSSARGPGAGAIERIPAGTGPDDVVLRPGDGDLLVMGGTCQRDWLHGVPKAPGAAGRISLTWRWTSRRGRPDTNPTYYDGRQYADGPRRQGSRLRRP